MTISQNDLQTIARLAYLNTDSTQSEQLTQEINSIIDFVDQLRSLNTTAIVPLFHPFSLHQRMRMDEVTEESCLAELSAIAPLFENDLYLVPKVKESGK